MSKEFLRQLPLFSGLSDADIDRLYGLAEPISVAAGEVLMEEGAQGDAMYIALEGTFEISKRSGERDIVIAGCGPGDVIGEISLLDAVPRTATVRAVNPSRLLRISRGTFEQLLTWSPSAALAVLRTVTTRLRNTEAMLRQQEKMASLGTLSAGLAHELNNPASAVRRGASQLREALVIWPALAARLGEAGLEPGQAAAINALRLELPRRAAHTERLDPLERSDREALVSEWMEMLGVEDAWELAPPLVRFGWDQEALQEVVQGFDPPAAALTVSWLATGATVYSVLDEVHEGAERISEIVKAVKSYSYLDQAPAQLIDVHEGLESTLVILRHKLAQGITIRRDFDPNLPRIEAYGGELNQVWTNIIDNAADALSGQGQITLRTRGRGDRISIEIADDGPGIPPEVLPRLFEAFFTTKEPGVGTGLGLHISYNIIVNQHRGEISVESSPGATTFHIALPVVLHSKS